MINLTKNPFFLSGEDIEWVENTKKSMTLEEKIGQLFVPIGYSGDPQYLEHVMLAHHIGGIMYRCGEAKEMQRTHRYLQERSHFLLELILRMEAAELQQMEHSTENKCRLRQLETRRMHIGSEK